MAQQRAGRAGISNTFKSMMHYTYAHFRQSDGKVFYIGKGCRRRAWEFGTRNDKWKKVANKHGVLVQVLAHWQTHEEALAHEVVLIASFRDMGCDLCNFTDGGEGATGLRPSAETRKRQAAAKRGKKLTQEHREKIRQSNLGRIFSEESRKKISFAHKGKVRARGYKRPPEVVAKVALANSKYWEEDGLRLNQKEWAALLGVRHSTISGRIKRGLTPSGKQRRA